ncbi:SPW repeat protein [Massilia sp. PAMC28688]|uniref:SPW repeat protein n=1 Tax=Massilia sp. PAMC28688 TaxID=2861283 RepID=UPI001C634DB0|nr:SPW repeat protein [Massilia sp. PAMC28688]QYF94532.1 SPW repeat protein [Massilia sp. PAMC28688]
MALHFTKRRWQDQVILLLGLWLFFSPWALDYVPGSAIALNANIAGTVIMLLAAFDLYKTYAWAVMLNLAVGVWVAVSPWVDALADRSAMMSNCVIVGVAVALLALWELRSDPELHRQVVGGT